MKLIRLPSGAWVDPDTVISIVPLPTSVTNIPGLPRTVHRARVVIDHGNNTEIVLANDNEHAQELAEHYGTLVNGLRD